MDDDTLIDDMMGTLRINLNLQVLVCGRDDWCGRQKKCETGERERGREGERDQERVPTIEAKKTYFRGKRDLL
jgi:hypothetical protein